MALLEILNLGIPPICLAIVSNKLKIVVQRRLYQLFLASKFVIPYMKEKWVSYVVAGNRMNVMKNTNQREIRKGHPYLNPT